MLPYIISWGVFASAGLGRARRIPTITGLSVVLFLTLLIGLMPIMFSSGAGADVMKRIAAPMLGGVGTALLLVLIVFPAIFSIWRGQKLSP